MKKILLLSSFFALTSLFFFSCEKKQIEAYVPEYLTGSDLLNLVTTPDVLFVQMEIDEATGAATGWLINKKGEILKINETQNPFDFEETELLINELNSFLSNATKTENTVDLQELSAHFSKTRALVNNTFKVEGEDNSALNTTYFIGFDLYLDDQDCENCPGTAVSMNECSQVLIKAEGALNGKIEHNFTRDIVNWMNELNTGL